MSQLYYGDPKTRGHFLSINLIYVQFLRIPNVHSVEMSFDGGTASVNDENIVQENGLCHGRCRL